jgi:hypothetical protein
MLPPELEQATSRPSPAWFSGQVQQECQGSSGYGVMIVTESRAVNGCSHILGCQETHLEILDSMHGWWWKARESLIPPTLLVPEEDLLWREAE